MRISAPVKKVRVCQRGQITIPRAMREKLNLETESILYAEFLGNGLYLCPKEPVILAIQKKGEELMRRRGLKLKELLDEN